MTRINFDLSKERVDEITALAEKTGATTRVQMFNQALTLLEWYVQEREAGRAVGSMDQDKDRFSEILLPGMPAIKREDSRTPEMITQEVRRRVKALNDEMSIWDSSAAIRNLEKESDEVLQALLTYTSVLDEGALVVVDGLDETEAGKADKKDVYILEKAEEAAPLESISVFGDLAVLNLPENIQGDIISDDSEVAKPIPRTFFRWLLESIAEFAELSEVQKEILFLEAEGYSASEIKEKMDQNPLIIHHLKSSTHKAITRALRAAKVSEEEKQEEEVSLKNNLEDKINL